MTKVLTEADADLAGLPRPGDLPPYIYGGETSEYEKVWTEASVRTLVSERDALAGRVAELEADARRYEWLKERLLGADFAWGDPATCVWVFETDAPISADLDESIDAALSATTPESKP